MDRTQKKCFIASIGMHLVLLGMMVFLPAFMTPPPPPKPNLVMMSSATIEGVLKAGRPGRPGAPAPRAPAPAPAPAPRSEPKQAAAPAQPREETHPTPTPPTPKAPKQVAKADTKRSEIPKAVPTKSTVKVNLDDIVVKNSAKTTSKQKSDSKSRESSQTSVNEKSAADARERSAQFGKSLSRLSQGLSNSVDIDVPNGEDGDGAAGTFDYGALVTEKYFASWFETEGISDEVSNVKVSVTISRDGRVRSASIINRSGNAALNRSVQSALDRVKIIAPFPPEMKGDQVTYKINFNLKNRRTAG